MKWNKKWKSYSQQIQNLLNHYRQIQRIELKDNRNKDLEVGILE